MSRLITAFYFGVPIRLKESFENFFSHIIKKGNTMLINTFIFQCFESFFQASRFNFEGWIWVLIASVPDLCILFPFFGCANSFETNLVGTFFHDAASL